MRSASKIILIFSLALNFLGASELMRPKMVLTSTPGGVHVSLDFQEITGDQWRTLLEHPTAFHEYGYGVSGAPGDAALPMITQVIPILSSSNISIVNLVREDYTMNNIGLKSAPQGHLDSDQQAVQITGYNWDVASRSQTPSIDLGDPLKMKNQQYLPVTIRPLILSADTRSLQIPRLIEFEIQGVQHAEEVQLTEDGSIRSVSLPDEQFANKGHYLIITPPVYESSIQYFASWKLRQGYKVTIVNTTVAGHSASAIKAFIQEAWDTWDSQPDFLLLIGDEDQGLPGHYIQNPRGENLVTDHPYSLLEGDDSFPELMVGRLSVDSITELLAFSAKIVAYERSPHMTNTDWFQRGLMISTVWGAASAQATKEWVADKLLENGFEHIYTAYHPNQSSTADIANPINQGVGFVNYRGYGMYNGWFGPDFNNENIDNLINNGSKTPVITSVVCGGGNFAASVDPCFGEKWTRVGTFTNPRGAVAFFGPSELDTHTQFNNVIDIGIYSGIFDLGLTTLGEALWHGKFELWRNYHQNSYFPFGQTAEFYHHVYNLLGDPGMQLWTAVPQILSVNHPDTLITGDNTVLVAVNDETGDPISGAYVALYNDENALGGYTDDQGEISIPFIADESTDVQLTITGPNLLPYLVTLPIESREHLLALDNWTLSDDQQLVAGASCPMDLTFSNSGPDLSNIELVFSSMSPGITLDESFSISSIAAGSSYVLDTANIYAQSGIPHGSPVTIELSLQANGEAWVWRKHFAVQAPAIQINALNLVNGVVAAGDSAEVELQLANLGGVSTGLISVAALEHDLLSFSNANMECPAVSADGLAVTESNLLIEFSDQVFPGERLTLQFECVQSGMIDTLEYILQVGDVNRYGPSQADDYGYRMFDDFDLSYSKAQSFDWLELDPAMGGSGTFVGMSDNYEEGDASRTIDLPFLVSYYGETFSQITVCTNGWAALGEQTLSNFHNRTIPSPIGPTAMLAPYWDDLLTNPGYVLTRITDDGDAFIIEWSRMRNLHYQNDLSFQVIIYNTADHPTPTGDSEIKFQYRSYENIDVESNFSTVGIEAPDFNSGLLASYNNVNDPSIGTLRNQSAILFSTDRGERLPDAVAAISSTNLSFTENPWSVARDSIVITNAGESPLAYNISMDSEFDLIPVAPAMLNMDQSKTDADPVTNASGSREGTDSFGYIWKKSTEEGGPAYHWINIEIPLNELPYLGDPDDGSIGPVPVGFDFPFYDDVYSEMYIGSNGTLTFESVGSPWLNTHLPSASAPAALLAPWWEDLNGDDGILGTVYYWTNDYDQCIITWKDFPKWGTSDLYTFQVILDAFGKVKYQYETIDGPTTSVTVGTQNANRNVGLQIHYNEHTLFEAETAISIQRPVQWFAASGWSGQVPPGESRYFVVDIQTQNMDPGHYEVPMTLTTNAVNIPESELLVSMDIVMGQPPWGDVNSDYLININDLLKMLNFIMVVETMDEIQSDMADLSGDVDVNVIDVILLLEEILHTN